MKVFDCYNYNEILGELNKYIKEGSVAIDINNHWIFIKNEVSEEVEDILFEHDEDYNSYVFINSFSELLDTFDNGDWFEFNGKEYHKIDCIELLKEKVIKDNTIEENIFKIGIGEILKYIDRLINLEFNNVLENEIRQIKELQQSILNDSKIQWR